MGEIYLKRLLLIVFFSLTAVACASDRQTKDIYDQTPDTEITSQPMQINYPSGQTELSKSLKELKGFWVPKDSYGYIVHIDADGFLTLVDEVTNIKLSFVSDSVKDYGRILNFISHTPYQVTQSVELLVDRSTAGEIVSFKLLFGNELDSETNFVPGNTSNYYDYEQTLLSANTSTD